MLNIPIISKLRTLQCISESFALFNCRSLSMTRERVKSLREKKFIY